MPIDTTPLVSGVTDPRVSAQQTDLREQVLRRLGKVGCACLPDLVNEISTARTADDLRPIIEGLLKDGKIRQVVDRQDPRLYTDQQTVYELVR